MLVDEVQRIDDALAAVPRRLRGRRRERRRASRALERLYRETARFAELLGDLREEARSRRRPGREEADPLRDRRALRERAQGRRQGDRDVRRGARRRADATRARSPRSTSSTASSSEWEPYVDVLRQRIELDVGEAELIDLKFRLGQTLEKHLERRRGRARELPRDPLPRPGARGRAARARGAARERRARAPRRPRSSRRSTRSAATGRSSSARSRSSRRARSDVAEARRAPAQDRAHRRRARSNDSTRAFDAQAAALKDDPSLAETRGELEQLAEGAGRAGTSSTRSSTRSRRASATRSSRATTGCASRAIDERLGEVDEAAQGYAHVLAHRSGGRRGARRDRALFTRTERWTDLIGVFRRRIELAERRRGARGALRADGAGLRRAARSPRGRDRRVPRGARARPDEPRARSRALDALFTRQKMWGELAENLEAQLALADRRRRAARAHAPPRGAARDGDGPGRRRPSRATARSSSATRRTRRRSPRSSASARCPSTSSPSPRSSSRSTGTSGDYAEAHRRPRGAGPAQRRRPRARSSSSTRSPSSTRTRPAISTRRSTRYARALAEDPANESDAAGARSPRARDGPLRRSRARLREARAAQIEDRDARERALHDERARLRERPRRRRQRDRALPQGARDRPAEPRGRRVARAALPHGGALRGPVARSCSGRPRSSRSRSRRRTRSSRPRPIEEDVLERPEAAIAVYHKVLELDAEDLRAIDALIKLYLGLSRWEELLAVYAKKADLVADAEEKKRIYYQVGAVYERELGDVPQAPSTPTSKILELDPDDLQALSRLDVLYEPAQNWQELLSVLTHESELTARPGRGDQLPVPDRRALREAPRRRRARHRALPRASSSGSRITSRRSQALEGLKGGDEDPLGAAAVLEPIYEAASEWPKLISVLEVQVTHATIRSRRSSSSTASRASTRTRSDDHASAFDTYARARRRRQRQRGVARQPRAPRRWSSNRWPQVAELYDAELDKLGERPGALRRARPAPRADLRGPARGRRERDRALPPRARGRRREPDRRPRARSPLHADRALERARRRSSRARPRSGRRPTRSSSSSTASARSIRRGSDDLDAAIAAYREVLNAAPEHAATLEALEGLFAGGVKQLEIGEILEPLYRVGERVGEARARPRGAARASSPQGQDETGSRRTTASPSSSKRSSSTRRRRSTSTSARSRSTRSTRRSARRSSASRASSTAAGRRSPTRTPTSSASHTDKAVQHVDRASASRDVFEDELGDIDEGRGDVPVRARRRAARRRGAREPRSHLPVARAVARARADPRAARHGADGRHARARRALRAPRRGLRDAARRHRRTRSARSAASSTSSTRRTRARSRALARIYEAQEAWTELNVVYERELENASGDVAEAEIRAKIAHLAADRLDAAASARSRRGSASSICAARIPRRSRALAEPLRARSSSGPSSSTSSSASSTSRRPTTSASNILTRRARIFSEQARARRRSRSRTGTASSTSTTRTSRRSAPSPPSGAAQDDPKELVAALHQMVDRAAAIARRRGAQGDLPRARQDLRRAARSSRSTRPTRGASCSRSTPTSRRWTRSRRSTAAEEHWTDVIDVKMQRAEALDEPAREDRGVPRGRRALARDRSASRTGARPPTQKILEIDADARRGVPRAREAPHGGRPLGAARSSSTSRASTRARRRATRPISSARSRASSRRSSTTRTRRSTRSSTRSARTSTIARPRSTSSAWRRRRGAGASSSRPRTTGSRQQTEPQQKIRLCLHLAKWYGEDLGHPEYAQPYYAQIVQLDPNNVGALRQMAQLYRKKRATGSSWARRSRARSTSPSTDVDRKEILTELGELLEQQMSQTDQARRATTSARSRSTRSSSRRSRTSSASTPRAGQNRELVDVLTRKVPALDGPGARSRPPSCASARSTRRASTIAEARGAGLPRGARDRRREPPGPARPRARLRGRSSSGRSSSRSSSSSSTSSRPSASASTSSCSSRRIQRSSSSRPTSRRSASSRSSRSTRTTRRRTSRSSAATGKLRQWLELINTYERHIAATLDRKTKVELYGAIAQVYADEVEDAERAIDAYQNIVDLDDTNIPALEALAKLYEKQGDAAQSIDYMTRVAELTQRRASSASRCTTGSARRSTRSSAIASPAQERYEMALDLDPAHLPTLGGAPADRDRQRRLRQGRALPRSGAEQHDGAARSARSSSSSSASSARRCSASTTAPSWPRRLRYEADAENEDAALPLVDEYIAQRSVGEGRAARRHARPQGGQARARRAAPLQNKLGMVLRGARQGRQGAQGLPRRRTSSTSPIRTTIRGLAEVCFRLKDWGARAHQLPEGAHRARRGRDRGARDVYYKLGCIKREQGQAKQAINNFEKALGVDAAHRPTLEALVGVYAELKDWKQVVAYKRQILDNVVDGGRALQDARRDRRHLERQGQEPAEGASRRSKRRSISSRRTTCSSTSSCALPGDRELGEDDRHAPGASPTWRRTPERKSKFLYTMAQLYRDKESDQERAVELFNEALDLNPGFLEAFERINKILTAQKDWKQLERAFRKMLHRCRRRRANAGPRVQPLAQPRPHLPRSPAATSNSAIEAFKMATRFKPDEAVERQILAELYEATEQTRGGRSASTRIVLQKDPLRVDPYRSLYKLYLQKHDVRPRLVHVRGARVPAQGRRGGAALLRGLPPAGMIQVKSRLDNEQWVKNLFHKDENLYIGKIFEMITPAAIVAKIEPAQGAEAAAGARQALQAGSGDVDRHLREDLRLGGAGARRPAARALRAQRRARRARRGARRAAGVGRRVRRCSPASRRRSSRSSSASTSSYYRGEHYIKNLFPTLNELKVLLFAGDQDRRAGLRRARRRWRKQSTRPRGAREVHAADAARGAAHRRAEVHRGRRQGEHQALDAGGRDHGVPRGPAPLRATSRSRRRSSRAEPQLPGDLPPRGEAEGAPRLLRVRAVLRAPQGARHRRSAKFRPSRSCSATCSPRNRVTACDARRGLRATPARERPPHGVG